MNVEARLRELIGPAAGRLHTARSRNDQVALDFRLWVRDACDRTDRARSRRCSSALVAKAEAHADALMPGFTHLQPAQPVTFGHHLMAYVEMFGRDAGALRRRPGADEREPAGRRGPGRLALPDRPPRDRRRRWASTGRPPTRSTASPTATSPWRRLAAATICATHLSRLAEEIVIWMTPQFGFMQLSRRLHHRLVDHAAEEEPGRRRAGARQGRPPAGLVHPAHAW